MGRAFQARDARPDSVPVLPTADRDACYSGVGVIVGLLYPTDAARREACSNIAREGAAACSESAIAEVRPDGREAWG